MFSKDAFQETSRTNLQWTSDFNPHPKAINNVKHSHDSVLLCKHRKCVRFNKSFEFIGVTANKTKSFVTEHHKKCKQLLAEFFEKKKLPSWVWFCEVSSDIMVYFDFSHIFQWH